jgi:hypothetical protein
MESPYNLVAGLDVHKKTVVAVVLQSAQPEQDYASSIFGTTQFGLQGTGGFLAAARRIVRKQECAARAQSLLISVTSNAG